MSDASAPTPKPPGLFSRGETGSRRVSLMIAAGMVAYVAGSWVTNRIIAALVEAEHPVSLPIEWLIVRIWLLALLPLFAWPVGRLGIGEPLTFGLVAPISAEAFDILKITAMDGFDEVFPSTGDAVARAVTLVIGLALNTAVAMRGARAAERSAAAAQALAEAQAKAHAEKLGTTASPPTSAAAPVTGTAQTPSEPQGGQGGPLS